VVCLLESINWGFLILKGGGHMTLDFNDVYFGIVEQLGQAGVSVPEMNQLLIHQLTSLTREDWYEMRDGFSRSELVDIIVRLVDEIGNLQRELNRG
jgi:hypothetical protein